MSYREEDDTTPPDPPRGQYTVGFRLSFGNFLILALAAALGVFLGLYAFNRLYPLLVP